MRVSLWHVIVTWLHVEHVASNWPVAVSIANRAICSYIQVSIALLCCSDLSSVHV